MFGNYCSRGLGTILFEKMFFILLLIRKKLHCFRIVCHFQKFVQETVRITCFHSFLHKFLKKEHEMKAR